MIIVCPSCGKNFNVRDDQIPDKGRLLQCSNCKHEWFYNKNTIPIDDNLDELPTDELTQESFAISNEEEDRDDEVIVEDKTSCLLYTSPSPRDGLLSRMPSSA